MCRRSVLSPPRHEPAASSCFSRLSLPPLQSKPPAPLPTSTAPSAAPAPAPVPARPPAPAPTTTATPPPAAASEAAPVSASAAAPARRSSKVSLAHAAPAAAGHEQHVPPQGYEQHVPPQGYEQHMPPQGYEQHMPPQGYEQHMPPQGYEQHFAPPHSGVGAMPMPGHMPFFMPAPNQTMPMGMMPMMPPHFMMTGGGYPPHMMHAAQMAGMGMQGMPGMPGYPMPATSGAGAEAGYPDEREQDEAAAALIHVDLDRKVCSWGTGGGAGR